MADDQGWGDVGYNGHPVLKTPELDALAASGLRFDRFHAAAPVCSPTRGSVLTGRHPNRFGCFMWGYPLRPQEITLAESLKSAGYATGHFGKWHVGSVRRGSPVNPGASGFDRWVSGTNYFDNDPILSDEGTAVALKGESSMVTVDAALDFIREEAEAKRPFLAVVWFGSPHVPHRALDEDRAAYADQPEHLQHLYGEITGLDRAVGKLRGEVKKLGIRENTIFWYCSDNGAFRRGGNNGGRRGYKGSIYEGGLLVPAILEWPARIPRPRATDVPCVTSDIYPTILDIVGVASKDQRPLDGVSLVPLIDGKNARRDKPIGFWRYPAVGIRTPNHVFMPELLAAQQAGQELGKPEQLVLDAGKIDKQYPHDRKPGHAAWLDGDWKLHRIAGRNEKDVRYELYNLADDPREQNDLLDTQPERAERMKTELDAWLDSVTDSLNGKDYPCP
ncbi:MAG TPA: N-acetylgalactosamine 6-sulfate sulfatase [Planctomycetaceae bacterium]|nr:N-acetylgalactosamine 6-sulfate sulfatase [Planctomycetaceae bacterium]